jgi:hypothetical protein
LGRGAGGCAVRWSVDRADESILDEGLERRDADALTRAEGTLDQDVVAVDPKDADLARTEPALCVDDEDLLAVSQRVPRHDDHVLRLGADDLGLDEEADRERGSALGIARAIGIVDAGDDVHHAALLVDLALRAHDPSGPLEGSTGEGRPQDDLGALARGFGGRDARVREVEEGDLVVRDGEADLGVVGRVDARDQVAAGHELADVGVLFADAAVEGCADLASLEVPPRLLEGGTGVGDGGLRDRGGAACVRELGGARDAGIREALAALQLGGRELELALGALQRRGLALDGELEVAALDPQERFPLLEEAAGREGRREPDDAAGDFGNEVGFGARGDGALGADAVAYGRRFGRNGAHGLDRPLGLLELDARRRRDDHERAEQTEHGDRDRDPELLRNPVQRLLQVHDRSPPFGVCAVAVRPESSERSRRVCRKRRERS